MQIAMRRVAAAVIAAALTCGPSAAIARPIGLQDAIARAEESSPLLRAAEAEVRAAEARVRQAGASPNPELDVEVENALGSGPYSGFSSTELTVSLAQRFELGGKRGARHTLARAELELAQLSFARSRADLLRDIRNAFADLLAAQQRLGIAREVSSDAEELARATRVFVENGRDPPLRQLRAEAALAESRANEAKAAADITTAKVALSSLMGIAETELEAAEPERAEAVPAITVGSALGARIAEAEGRVAEARVGVERAGGVPDVTARAGLRGFAETDDIAVVGGVSLPLPIRDRNRGGVEAARASAQAADARALQARLDAARELRDAQTLLEAANARLGALEGSGLEQAREAVRVARIGYAAGKFSLVEVLDAQAALNNARSGIVDARRDRERALASLQRAQAQ
jgi:outer membrane protein, heavy metal efflux system